jgi:hypothetical protein
MNGLVAYYQLDLKGVSESCDKAVDMVMKVVYESAMEQINKMGRLAAWERSGMMEWQPIETAPKDTEIIAIFCSDYGYQDKPTIYGPWTVRGDSRGKWFASWDGMSVIESEGYWGTDYKEAPLDPTHWMPLPPPPA